VGEGSGNRGGLLPAAGLSGTAPLEHDSTLLHARSPELGQYWDGVIKQLTALKPDVLPAELSDAAPLEQDSAFLHQQAPALGQYWDGVIKQLTALKLDVQLLDESAPAQAPHLLKATEDGAWALRTALLAEFEDVEEAIPGWWAE
jgi:hypothetical protein